MTPVPVIGMQVILAPIGRIRLGIAEPIPGKTTKGGQQATRPVKLETFRFTSEYPQAVEMAAAKHGGDVREWRNQGHREWEVITPVDELMVGIPNDAGAIDTNYEW